MRLSRRTFLRALAASGLGWAGAARADFKAWQRGRIDKALDKFGGAVSVDESGLLDQPAAVVDDCLRGPQSPYKPQAGDIVFSRSKYWIYRIGHKCAGAGEPSHSGIVWQRPDGSFALLEAGPFDVPIIQSTDLMPHLAAYHGRGHVWLRRRTCPLTPDQTCRLADFAMKQEGKPFARLRLIGQMTPFRCRGPLRTYVTGQSHGCDRYSYYCAELVTESLIYIGALNAEDCRPCATYPCDLFCDDSRIPFLKEHFKLAPSWEVPQRWRPCVESSG